MSFYYGFIFESTAKKIKVALQQQFNEHKIAITVDQWVVLLELHDYGVLNQVTLSKLCSKDAPTTTHIIKLLLKKELIIRELSEDDKRCYNISLSKKGRALIQKLLPIVIEFRRKGWHELDKKDEQHLVRIANKISQNLY
ncbi:MarR family transcriptional regulator [Ferruginibacter lapsinanis]|uniref:MarR family winged helix-turn-helix transcriptional regulator n=1 Tax=Ferruginibacter lapsinanis TaxID=563172 RepID=UPI001E2E95A1|nr:MarR family transcriptional regulator [Ferruginibacter lapsinanis]UEG50767.1 MarR family transcriptional regulator [Ferruginibacter lapsinanis]